ncbi:MAG: hypothetical protein JWR65_4293, partial [Massilia sp.]|nr:hypothetical protein [Massilia sp.]
MHKLRPHQAAGILISLLGLVVMAGYWTNERRLIHLTPEHFPMAFNVALCFLMAGAALVLPESRPEIQKKGQQAVGLLIAVLAGLSGLQDLLNSGFGIDELFATQWFDDRNPHPGRMAPLTSVGLLLVAGCFLLKHWLPSSR